MIRAEHIVKSFDGRVVLDDISVEFETGKTNLIIGRSGSGKTVLLKTLVGLHEPDSGDVWYDEVNFSKLGFRERKSIRKDIGMIFQGGALLDSSTVEENVKLKIMPISLRMARRCLKSSCVKLVSSYQTSPESGSWSPTSVFSSTVLPEPLRPMIRLVFPVSNSIEISSSTTRPSNDLVICSARII